MLILYIYFRAVLLSFRLNEEKNRYFWCNKKEK